MTAKTLSIFYGADNLPYKDSAREIHFPLVGNTFNGANNTTKIRFYVDQIGGVDNVTWLVVSKLPNGQIGNEVLNSNNAVFDEELGEYYLELELSSYYTSLKGDVYLSLNGYQGGVEVEQDADTGVYEIYGTPTIQATGVVKIGINYAPQIIPGSHFNTSDLQQILGALSGKANINDVIIVVNNFSDESFNLTSYSNGQLFYEKATKLIYRKESGELKYFDGSAIVYLGSQTFPQVVGNYIDISITNEQYSILDSSPNNIARIDDDQDIHYFRKQAKTQGQTWVSINGTDLYTLAEYGDFGNYYLRLTYRGTLTSKQYVDTELAKKVDKISTANQVYGTNGSGEQSSYTVALYENSSIPLRNVNGQLVVPETPTNVLHATSKSYVDTAITTAMTSALVYKGSKTVAEINALDTSTLKVGDFYNVSDSGIITLGSIEVVAGDNIAWTGSGWDKMTMDLSAYDDKFIAAGFFEVQAYNETTGEITFVYASDLYSMSYNTSTGILTIEAN